MSQVAPSPSKAEFERGRWDVARWAWVYLGIKLHPGQRKFAEAYLARTDSRWRALWLWIMVSAGNRAGKTLALAVIILHSCVYRMGLEPPDPNDERSVRHWLNMPYHWWHFAVEQAPAEQVFAEIAWLLGGVHPAQKRGCPWAEQLGEGDTVLGVSRIATLTDTGLGPWCTGPKERGEYAHIKLRPEFGGAEIHFRSTKAKALSAIGQNMHGLSFDEAGLESNLTYLLEDVMHARRLGTGGQFLVISTPSVATSTDFQDLWLSGDPEDPFRKPRRLSLRMSSRQNVGYGLDRESFDALIAGMDEAWIKQNIDGEFIQSVLAWFNADSIRAAVHPGLPEYQDPIAGHVYLQAIDPGLQDKCWSLVFEVLPDGRIRGVSLTREVGKQTTRGIVAMGARDFRKYKMVAPDAPRDAVGKAKIEVGVDTTALGGHMFRDLIEEQIEAVTSVEFGGYAQVKRRMLSDLRAAFDEGRIEVPEGGFWGEFIKQHINYKLLDRKIEQDLVMGAAIIVKLLRSAPLVGVDNKAMAEQSHFDYYATPELMPEEHKGPPDGINRRSVRSAMARRNQRDRAQRITTLTTRR